MNDKELKAIRAVERLEKIWPNTLWLFATGMAIHIMKCGPGGEQVVLDHGGMDPDMEVGKVLIPNDGGDW